MTAIDQAITDQPAKSGRARVVAVISSAVIICLFGATQFSQPIVQGSFLAAALVFLLAGLF